MSNQKSADVTCDCGHTFSHSTFNGRDGQEFGLPDCPKCQRSASGGNWKTGEVFSWNTPQEVYESNQEYERQLFESDMNEWYGRGEW